MGLRPRSRRRRGQTTSARTSGSATVLITDNNLLSPSPTFLTTTDGVYFNTPISAGGIILSGFYPITAVGALASEFYITAAANATSSVTIGTLPAFTTANGSSTVTVTFVAHGLTVGDVIVFPIATTTSSVTILGSYAVNTVPTADTFTITAATVATAKFDSEEGA